MPKLVMYAEHHDIAFDLLSDPDLEVIKRWGLVNPDKPELPHPTAVIVDSAGVIRYLRQDVDHTTRPSAAELLAAIRDLDEPKN